MLALKKIATWDEQGAMLDSLRHGRAESGWQHRAERFGIGSPAPVVGPLVTYWLATW
jgi:hypothetical protein